MHSTVSSVCIFFDTNKSRRRNWETRERKGKKNKTFILRK